MYLTIIITSCATLFTAFGSQKADQKEFELTQMRKETKGSKIEIFAVVDLDNETTYALKVRKLVYIAGFFISHDTHVMCVCN